MSKRALPSHGGQRPMKRQATTDQFGPMTVSDALSCLLDYAEELTDSLRSLKQATANDSIQHQLSNISREILPAIRLLAASPDLGAGDQVSSGETTNEPEVSELPESSSPHQKSHQTSEKGVPMPPMALCTPWKHSETPLNLPLLPKILDPKLEEIAFTHPGLSHEGNYERLEWLGDAYLELIATGFIYETFRDTSSGRCSQVREQLVRNITLADFFRQYGLPSRARLPRDITEGRAVGKGRSNDKDLTKTQSDMFEAYVAAVIISDPQNGLALVIEWLKALWGRTISDQIKHVEKRNFATTAAKNLPTDEAADRGHATTHKILWKERLSTTIGGRGILIQYKDMGGPKKDKNNGLPLFTVGVYLDGWGEKGKLLGIGTAQGKKEAGNKAAETALQNKKLIRTYTEKKRMFEEAQASSVV